MTQNGLLTINDFAERAQTTRDTLLHYDKLGILEPAMRAENNYRYYTPYQLQVMKVVRLMQQLGMSLDEIKELTNKRTPALFLEVGSEQVQKIDAKIDEWVRARKLLITMMKLVQSVANVDEDAITIQFLPAEAIVLGELNDFSRNRKDYDAELSFYQDVGKKYPGMDLKYPTWVTYTQETIRRGEYEYPERFYLYNPEGFDRRPAGLYAVGYTRGGYGDIDSLVKRLLSYIEENGYEMCGNAYEEYPLGEFCIADGMNYLIRVMITVRQKKV